MGEFGSSHGQPILCGPGGSSANPRKSSSFPSKSTSPGTRPDCFGRSPTLPRNSGYTKAENKWNARNSVPSALRPLVIPLCLATWSRTLAVSSGKVITSAKHAAIPAEKSWTPRVGCTSEAVRPPIFTQRLEMQRKRVPAPKVEEVPFPCSSRLSAGQQTRFLFFEPTAGQRRCRGGGCRRSAVLGAESPRPLPADPRSSRRAGHSRENRPQVPRSRQARCGHCRHCRGGPARREPLRPWGRDRVPFLLTRTLPGSTCC